MPQAALDRESSACLSALGSPLNMPQARGESAQSPANRSLLAGGAAPQATGSFLPPEDVVPALVGTDIWEPSPAAAARSSPTGPGHRCGLAGAPARVASLQGPGGWGGFACVEAAVGTSLLQPGPLDLGLSGASRAKPFLAPRLCNASSCPRQPGRFS